MYRPGQGRPLESPVTYNEAEIPAPLEPTGAKGSGIPRILREAEELGLPELQIMEIGMRLRCTVTLAEKSRFKKPPNK